MQVFQPAAPFAVVCILASPFTPAWLDVGLSSATFLTCMSQQFHAWAHSKASSLPTPVKALQVLAFPSQICSLAVNFVSKILAAHQLCGFLLQERGLLVSRKAHGAHHRAPFEGNYCIVSGVWNPILDAGGDNSFFRRAERFVHKKTGVEPRCWHEPDYSWQEE